MSDNKILIISNCGLSNNESNGRILSLLLHNYADKELYSYAVGGLLDKKGVNYIRMNDKRNLKSLLSFGYIKPKLFVNKVDIKLDDPNTSDFVKNKKTILYLLRNILYSVNFHITRFLEKIIKKEGINTIFLFGGDAPYLYRLAYKLSKKTNAKLIIYTCEDYPIKNYNYIEKGKDKDIFYKLLSKSLHKQTRKAYKQALKSYFNSELLKEDYEKEYAIPNPEVKFLPSIIEPVDYKPRPIKNITYGGNLYEDRINSLIDVLKALYKIDSSIVVNIYGKISDEGIALLSKQPNASYKGVIPYEQLVEILKASDMLLHIEGFSDYYIKDCKHAFSTKLSDYYMLGIPFFMYAPKEIAGTQYALLVNKDYVATGKTELEPKLKDVISGKKYAISGNKTKNFFSPLTNI